MLGYAVWQERFASDPSIVGRSIRMGTIARQVVGVAAPGFRFPANNRTEAIVPMRVPAHAPAGRKNGWVFAAGRLKPDAPRHARRPSAPWGQVCDWPFPVPRGSGLPLALSRVHG